ncbi:hypothetical protein K505DRAFT_98891 [Melanomma pulvis-pyrius CBS 109.77]|uniref:Uncharacterized protein n=1 Tax=Melanomma pulvis-pyrius CBS 109.77 TaxID=1314802 RepID=A0A6A6WYC4_9PLEO|nr:hypothetical protein K505DRAFT_98891 [Melanomma pulvis-pyrius CBS 109.77]
MHGPPGRIVASIDRGALNSTSLRSLRCRDTSPLQFVTFDCISVFFSPFYHGCFSSPCLPPSARETQSDYMIALTRRRDLDGSQPVRHPDRKMGLPTRGQIHHRSATQLRCVYQARSCPSGHAKLDVRNCDWRIRPRRRELQELGSHNGLGNRTTDLDHI